MYLLQPRSNLLLQEGGVPGKGAPQGGSADDPRAAQGVHQEGHALLPLAVWGRCRGRRCCQPRTQPCTHHLRFRTDQLHKALHSTWVSGKPRQLLCIASAAGCRPVIMLTSPQSHPALGPDWDVWWI